MITSKFFLCNFSCTNVYQAFLYNVKVAKTNCFYFCPHFCEKFVSCSILHQSIIYEQNNEVCCCYLNCCDKFRSETNFGDQCEVYFNQLKKKFDSILLCCQQWSVCGEFFQENFVKRSLILFHHT